MDGMSIIFPLGALAFLAVLIALGVFVAVRLRSGDSLVLSFRTILLAYFYLMSIASLLVLTAGLSVGVKALLSDAFGREFSYWMPPTVRYMPPEGRVPASREPLKPAPVSGEEQERSRREAERQYKSDLVQAGTLTVLGTLLWGLHWYGRRRLERAEDMTYEFFSKAYSAILLAVFGVAGIISLTTGVYEVLRYFLIPVEEFSSNQAPGGAISAAIVFVPCWVYFLAAVLKQSGQETASAPS